MTLTLGLLQMGTHVVELAVVEAGAVRLLQMQDGDVLALGEAPHLGAEPVADLVDDGRGGDGLAQVSTELVDLAANLEDGHVRVQVEPIDTLEFEPDVTVQDIVDVHDVRHGRRDSARGPALPVRQAQGINGRVGGRPGGGPDPLPLKNAVRGHGFVAWSYLRKASTMLSPCARPRIEMRKGSSK